MPSDATNTTSVLEELTELTDDSFTALTDRSPTFQLNPTYDSFSELTDWSLTFQLNPTDDNLVSYLAGYAMMKGYKQLDCLNCSSAYELSVARSRDELRISRESRLAFLQNKMFDWAKHGLLASSCELYELTANFEKVLQMNIEY